MIAMRAVTGNDFVPSIRKLFRQGQDRPILKQGYERFGLSRKGFDDPNDEHCAIFTPEIRLRKWMEEHFGYQNLLRCQPAHRGRLTFQLLPLGLYTFQLKGVHPPGFAFQLVNTHLDRKSSKARRRGALLIWQHIATLPPSLPVIFCGTFNTVKESATGRFLLGRSQEHGLAGDLRDAWGGSRRRRNGGVVYTQHGFKGERRTAADTLKLVFMALCMCFDRLNQDLHVDWVLFRSRSLAPVYSEVVCDHDKDQYPSDHYPLYVEFQLPRSVSRIEGEEN